MLCAAESLLVEINAAEPDNLLVGSDFIEHDKGRRILGRTRHMEPPAVT